jgi:hypothetical protein
MQLDFRRRLMQATFVVSCLAGGWTIAVWLSDGLVFQIGHMQVSSRHILNPALLVILTGAAAYFLARPEERRREWPVLAARAIVSGAVAAVIAFGLAKGLFVAAASDAYGYVSQADQWARGDLIVRQPWAREMTWPGAAGALAPLGYRPHRPAPHGTDIVPIYSPGVPMLMAAFKIVGGARAVYYVVPLLGGLAVWITWLIGRRFGGPFVGAAAAVLLATSPTFLFEVTAPASDVAATVWWSLAILALMFTSRAAVFGAGVATGLAILTRPNVAPLALVLLAPDVWRFIRASSADHRRSASVRLALFAAGSVPACVAIGLLNRELYGSPLSSGYGSLNSLYAWSHAWANLSRYPRWLIDTQTPGIILAALAPLVLARSSSESRMPFSPRATASLWLGCLAGIFGLYLFYLPFDDWWYLRFLMPMFPVLFVLTSAVLLRAAGERTLLATAVVALLAWHGLDLALDRGASHVWEAEQRYLEAGTYVAQSLPERAALISLQHSGSARFYSGRITVRYDFIGRNDLDRVVNDLRRLGYLPYFLLDEAEEASFRSRFGNTSPLGALDWAPEATLHRNTVRIYDPARRQ